MALPLLLALSALGAATGASPGAAPPALDATAAIAAPLAIRAEDLALHLRSGAAIPVRGGEGVEGLVLEGEGTMTFSPPVASEQSQLRRFCGKPVLELEFDSAYVRASPGRLGSRLTGGTPGAPDPRLLARARKTLEEDSAALPLPGELAPHDFFAEIRARGRGLLAYVRRASEPEDIMLLDLRRRRRVVLYPSREHREAVGFDYGDEYGLPYRVTHYDLDVAVDPALRQISGTAALDLTALVPFQTVELRLDPGLAVRGARGPDGKALAFYRPPRSDRLLVRLAPPLDPGASSAMTLEYAGTASPQALPIGAAVSGPGFTSEEETRALYSTGVWWYPQSPVHNHASATIRVRVPQGVTAVASGLPGPPGRGGPAATFRVDRPVRYLALLAGRLTEVFDGPIAGGSVRLRVFAEPELVRRAQKAEGEIGRIVEFFASRLGGAPYPALTVVFLRTQVPAGHSPATLAFLGDPGPRQALGLADNPSYDRDDPGFRLAHEIAHQWWGQAVGWRNYRQEWLSEAFAQYFAALYVRRARGRAAFARTLAWLARWATRAAPFGPIDLGNRAGAIDGEAWVHSALVYDAGALVLRDLRKTIGDDAFWEGLRAYYRCWKFRRADTDSFRAAMEEASGRDLRDFFARRIEGE